MEDLTIYTPDEVAQLLKTSTENVLHEIQKGHLQGFLVGTEWRITRNSITDFISRGGSPTGTMERSKILGPSVDVIKESSLQEAPPFQHTWPNGTVEEYSRAFEGTVQTADNQYAVQIGIGDRKVAGKLRKRVVVFVDNRPTVEFAGVDDFEQTNLVASLVTLPNKKRLKPKQPIPREYRNFDLRPYNSVVTGPRALSTMAVVSRISDYDVQVAHALIRAKYRSQRQ